MTISKKNILRLCRYRECLYRFKGYGVETILSADLADSMGTTAVQVRKDFSLVGFKGKKKVGYHIDTLISNIDNFLKKNTSHTAIIIGCYPLGLHLGAQQLFLSTGLRFAAIFDDAPSAQTIQLIQNDSTSRIPVLPCNKLIDFVLSSAIKLAVITTPPADAQRALDLLIMAGIQGVMNLTGADLKSPGSCVVTSINIMREFENLIFNIENRKPPIHSANRGKPTDYA